MADFLYPADSAVEPDAPVTAQLIDALRQNPVAIAEGAAGAPRINSDTAINFVGFGEGVAAQQLWARQRALFDSGIGGVGTFVLGHLNAVAAVTFGSTFAGSLIAPSNADGTIGGSGSLTGTWRALGAAASKGAPGDTGSQYVTLWQRIV